MTIIDSTRIHDNTRSDSRQPARISNRAASSAAQDTFNKAHGGTVHASSTSRAGAVALGALAMLPALAEGVGFSAGFGGSHGTTRGTSPGIGSSHSTPGAFSGTATGNTDTTGWFDTPVNSGPSIGAGAIVGIVAGSAVVIGLLVAAGCICMKRRRAAGPMRDVEMNVTQPAA